MSLKLSLSLDINYYGLNGFCYFCKIGDFPRICYFIDYYTQLPPNHMVSSNFYNITIYEKAFQIVCENGYFDIAQWFYKKELLSNGPINYYEKTFQLLCKNGHIDIAQWLIEKKPTIDIVANNDLAYEQACYNGYLNLAQWLLAIKPITVVLIHEADYVFQSICQNGRACSALELQSNSQLHIIKWLFKMNPTITILYINNMAFQSACIGGRA